MLKELRIFNIILIESAEISFENGLNAITGETGSGKSAIMHALSLITGARADSTIVRKGMEKGSVEAYFEGPFSASLRQILDDAGISLDEEEGLIVRREISANGKSRAFVNDQLVQIALIKVVGECLVDIVSQHAGRHLLSVEAHRRIIDLYGDLDDRVAAFGASWERESRLQKELNALVGGEAQRLREIEANLRELEELQEANLKEGEDEELFSEYSLLVNGEELANKSGALLQVLNGEKQSVIQLLSRQKSIFDELVMLDASLTPTYEAFSTASIELQEIAYTLAGYHNRIERNPSRCEKLNDRLSLISLLKRKYGATISEIHAYRQKLSERLAELENSDNEIERIKQELAELSACNAGLASQLTAERKRVAKRFESEMVRQLVSLNMPKVEFHVEVSSQKRSAHGDDSPEFFFVPNVGEHRIPIKECASGGELSRILLALHVMLAGKGRIPTLVFDEIDEGIGGTTANLVGEKLCALGTNHQVLCITHFPQVAKQAASHLQISKAEKNGRTATEVRTLDEAARDREISRMLGL